MEKINIKEFQKNMYLYINNLPIALTRKGKVVATIMPIGDIEKGKQYVVTTNIEVVENKKESKVTTTCDKCKLECQPEEIGEHWEDGSSFMVCVYCRKKKKRIPEKKVDLSSVKMNDKMKQALGL